MDGEGNPIIGNADVVPARRLTEMGVRDLKVRRNGKIIAGRVAVAQLSDGKLLAVGSDMQVQSDVEELFGRASLLAGQGGAPSVLLLRVLARRMEAARARMPASSRLPLSISTILCNRSCMACCWPPSQSSSLARCCTPTPEANPPAP